MKIIFVFKWIQRNEGEREKVTFMFEITAWKIAKLFFVHKNSSLHSWICIFRITMGRWWWGRLWSVSDNDVRQWSKLVLCWVNWVLSLGGGGVGFIDIRRGSDPQTTWQNNPHGKENTNQNKCILQEAIRISLFDSPSQPIQAHIWF